MILMSYDGSADAQAAIDHLAQVMPGTTVTVLTVWESFLQTMARTGMGMGMGMGISGSYAPTGDVTMDECMRQAALETATDGVERARAGGLVATPWIEHRDRDVATTILAVADEIDADAIVMGTRGRSGIKAYVLGSVSRDVVELADRAILVVPSPALAQRRREHVQHHAAHA